ncbi:hypothetical protein UFOVP181_84 [uncultured Caudovirales phage]|uniref:Uncharacterized protein n=1 Tax=uncultured Caudovirales phage TaxID=2100421 RepID=A0A6J5KS27_9CAUD|nr:hypothetical protein UFOVP57_78 [uncultured Caudovirales phage]CAB5208603.1 hypothetical protein UFOVP181_84 [uncultured Caudovirales phage]
MPSTLGTLVTANYLKTAPTTQISTRKLKPMVLIVTGLDSNYADPASLFSRTIRAIQQNVEVYAVFNPSGNYVTILVASDTTPQDNATDEANNNRDAYLEAVLAKGGITAEVWNADISGNSITYND